MHQVLLPLHFIPDFIQITRAARGILLQATESISSLRLRIPQTFNHVINAIVTIWISSMALTVQEIQVRKYVKNSQKL